MALRVGVDEDEEGWAGGVNRGVFRFDLANEMDGGRELEDGG